MVQIENEYGSYSNDKDYLALNRKMFIDAGFDGQLYTCDPEAAIKDGHLPGLLPAINGVDDVAKVKRLIKENHDGKGPSLLPNGTRPGLIGGEQNTTPYLQKNMWAGLIRY
jgi:beta-galactosidase